MELPRSRALKDIANRRLSAAGEMKKIVLIYTGILTAVSAVATVVQYGLQKGISHTGGLQNIGARSVLSTASALLPLVQFLILVCLGLGFTAAMLRIARGQYTSPKTMKAGVERFWPLLRCTLLKGVIYAGIGIASSYLSILIFALSPLSDAAAERVRPVLTASGESLMGLPAMDAAMEEAVIEALGPMVPAFLLICLAVFLGLCLPLMYRYRMTDYLIIDRPGIGALAALRESRFLMRGNRIRLFRLDLSFWWYYALTALAAVICYGDTLMEILGISMPLQPDVMAFLFYGAYLAINFAVCYFFTPRVECAYAVAYDSLAPKQPAQQGAVLGNIFQM